MDMFEYIMVLASIIVGLGMTHLLQGLAVLVQHPNRGRTWWVHLAWVAWAFFFSIFWWWWEFRYQTLEEWTFALYCFVVAYAFAVYLAAAMLFPIDLGEYEGFKDYFLSRRGWFFGLLISLCFFDLADSQLKGADYFASLGAEYFSWLAFVVTAAIIGILTRNERAHGLIAILVLGYQISWAVRMFWTFN